MLIPAVSNACIYVASQLSVSLLIPSACPALIAYVTNNGPPHIDCTPHTKDGAEVTQVYNEHHSDLVFKTEVALRLLPTSVLFCSTAPKVDSSFIDRWFMQKCLLYNAREICTHPLHDIKLKLVGHFYTNLNSPTWERVLDKHGTRERVPAVGMPEHHETFGPWP